VKSLEARVKSLEARKFFRPIPLIFYTVCEGPELRIANSPAPFENIRKHPTQIALQGLNDPQQFQHVNLPLSSLIIGHEGLRLAE
jgi:hypothetical protein